jgi:hypothetical protein
MDQRLTEVMKKHARRCASRLVNDALIGNLFHETQRARHLMRSRAHLAGHRTVISKLYLKYDWPANRLEPLTVI